MFTVSFPKFTVSHFVHHSRFCTQTNIKDIFIGSVTKSPTRVKGWVKGLRRMKDTVFIDINDGSHPKHLQLIVHKSLVPKELSFGASIESSGSINTNSNDKIELVCDSLRVVGSCSTDDGYPFGAKKLYSDDYLRQFLHLRSRTNRFGSLLRIRHSCFSSVNDFFLKHGFIHIDTPVLTSNDCEGAGEVFKVLPDNENSVPSTSNRDSDYFNTKTFLTVSGQLHLEAMARCLNQVYCFGPTFRAENSKSRLHLSEFYMVEAETSLTDDILDVASLIEKFVKETITTLSDRSMEDIISYNKFNDAQSKLSEETITNLTDKKFAVMTYCDVVDILEKHSNSLNTSFVKGSSLTKDQELFLVRYNDGVPLFVIDWPKDSKPFYMKLKSGDNNLVLALDLLCPIVGEVCGGSIREDNYDILHRRIQELDFSEKLDWYLELRKFGNVKTGGFGLGFERLLQVILGTNNIKDTIPFPRWPHNCKL